MDLVKSVFAAAAATGPDFNSLGVNQSTASGPFSFSGDWTTILSSVTNLIFIIAGVIAFLYLIYSGFIYLTAGGNPDAAKKGQQGLLNAILGLVIIFLAFGIVRFIVSFLNKS